VAVRKAGQVAILQFPKADLAQGKPRPVLLVTPVPGPYDDWLVCMISTQLQQAVPPYGRAEVDSDAGRGYAYCAVHKIGDSLPGTAQSGGESEEGRRPAPLGRARGEGRTLAARLVRGRGPSPRTKQRERTCSQNSTLLSKVSGAL